MAELVLIFDGVIGSLLAKQVGTSHIADGAILSGKIGSGQIGTPHIAAAAITSSLIGSGQVGIPHLAPGTTSGRVLTDQGAAAALVFAAAPASYDSMVLDPAIGVG